MNKERKREGRIVPVKEWKYGWIRKIVWNVKERVLLLAPEFRCLVFLELYNSCMLMLPILHLVIVLVLLSIAKTFLDLVLQIQIITKTFQSLVFLLIGQTSDYVLEFKLSLGTTIISYILPFSLRLECCKVSLLIKVHSELLILDVVWQQLQRWL